MRLPLLPGLGTRSESAVIVATADARLGRAVEPMVLLLRGRQAFDWSDVTTLSDDPGKGLAEALLPIGWLL